MADNQNLQTQQTACTIFNNRERVVMRVSQIALLTTSVGMAYRSYNNHKKAGRAIGAFFGYGALAFVPLAAGYVYYATSSSDKVRCNKETINNM